MQMFCGYEASKSNGVTLIYHRHWRRKGHPTLVFLPGESQGRGNLVGYSPRGRKELDTTEQLTHTRSGCSVRAVV